MYLHRMKKRYIYIYYLNYIIFWNMARIFKMMNNDDGDDNNDRTAAVDAAL